MWSFEIVNNQCYISGYTLYSNVEAAKAAAQKALQKNWYFAKGPELTFDDLGGRDIGLAVNGKRVGYILEKKVND
jgi:hypothetical protein